MPFCVLGKLRFGAEICDKRAWLDGAEADLGGKKNSSLGYGITAAVSVYGLVKCAGTVRASTGGARIRREGAWQWDPVVHRA
jgi:hypothetical protein